VEATTDVASAITMMTTPRAEPSGRKDIVVALRPAVEFRWLTHHYLWPVAPHAVGPCRPRDRWRLACDNGDSRG
jgi:hypothetical protein